MIKIKEKIIAATLTKILMFKGLRNTLLKPFEKKLYKEIVEKNTTLPPGVAKKKYQFIIAMLRSGTRSIDRGFISKEVMHKIIKSLVTGGMIGKEEQQKAIDAYKAEHHGELPPSLIVFSPTQKCNLKCTGCYAVSKADTLTTLPFEIVEKVVDETYHKFGNRFMTISGGEPFLYEDKGKTLFDIWEKYPDMYFLVYTNGTKISPEVAKRLADLGNVTPAISVEGFEEHTDQRRGKGVHSKVLTAFKNLREAGVPYGVSVTSTRLNADTLLKDEFYDHYFLEHGVSYMWQFQLMPIGRGRESCKLAITPKQRYALYKQWKHILEDKQYMVADFWNSGMLSDGCLAYGRHGGYLYINWDGNIMPCVFVPYYVDNVVDLYKKGKSLADAMESDFFKRGRKWQKEFGLDDKAHAHNWLMPCSIRDHYDNFKKNILTKDAKPENKDAAEALDSKEYYEMMKEFEAELTELTQKVWDEEYLQTCGCGHGSH